MTTTTPARDLSGLKGVDIDAVHRTFGARVRKAREAFDMTQADLADETNVSQARISAIELASAERVAFDTVLRIARALDVSLDYLAGLSNELGKFPLEAE